jgi:antitoxin CptB
LPEESQSDARDRQDQGADGQTYRLSAFDINMAELDKIRWQCRRGMLELDLILEKFNQRHLAGLDREQLERFQELLAFPDNDLLDLVMARIVAPDRRYNNVLQLLRSA